MLTIHYPAGMEHDSVTPNPRPPFPGIDAKVLSSM